MFGTYYYSIPNLLLVEDHPSQAVFADKLDMKNFLHSNSPYLKSYIEPSSGEPREIDFVSPDTGEDMLSPSPVRSLTLGLPRPISEMGESCGHHEQFLKTNHFGTNALDQNHAPADFEPATSSDGDHSNDTEQPVHSSHNDLPFNPPQLLDKEPFGRI